MELVVAPLDAVSAGRSKQPRDFSGSRVDQHCRAVDLGHDQERVLRQADSHWAVFNHRHAPRIHQLDRHGKRSVRRERQDRTLGRVQVGKGGAIGPHFFGTRDHSEPKTREGGQRAFRTDHQPLPVLAPRAAATRRPAESLDLSVQQHRFDPQHVVARDTVAETVRAARVHRHIAAERADWAARRIRWIHQSVWRQGGVQLIEHDAAFNFAPVIVARDLFDVTHRRRVDDNAALSRYRPAGERRAGPTHRHGHIESPRVPQQRGQLGGVGGYHHRVRAKRLVSQSVRIVARQLRGRGQDPAPTHHPTQLVDKLRNCFAHGSRCDGFDGNDRPMLAEVPAPCRGRCAGAIRRARSGGCDQAVRGSRTVV